MTITEAPHNAAPAPPSAPPGSDAPTPVSRAPEVASRPPADGSHTVKRKPSTGQTEAPAPTRDALMTTLSLIAALGGIAVGVIGFAMSYSTLAHVALSWGFSEELAPWFPIGVDASILAFLALDLYLIRKDVPWPLLRLAAHGMTAATIWFNASSQGAIAQDPVQAASHGVMPALFVLGVEAARRLVIKKAQLDAGVATDRIPVHRWFLAPVSTPRFYRQMRLHGITSYPEMIARQQEHRGYEQWLCRKHGGDLSRASEDERLPMTMAKYGYTVAEALALPEQQEVEAEERARRAEERRRAAQQRTDGLAQHDEEHRRAEQQRQARAAHEEELLQIEQEAEKEEANARAAARIEAARAEAARKRKEAEQAEQAAADEDQALQTEAAAEARARAAESDRAAAEDAEVAAEARRAAAAATEEAAERLARREKLEAEAASARRAAAEAREQAAEIEVRAVEAEDIARLSPRQRAVRKVARMILTAGGSAQDVPLARIQEELHITSPGTASEYRTEAQALLEEHDYQP